MTVSGTGALIVDRVQNFLGSMASLTPSKQAFIEGSHFGSSVVFILAVNTFMLPLNPLAVSV